MASGADLQTYVTLLPVGFEMAVCWRAPDWDPHGGTNNCSMKNRSEVLSDAAPDGPGTTDVPPGPNVPVTTGASSDSSVPVATGSSPPARPDN